MPIDPGRLLARPFPVLEHAYTQRDTQLYALGLGLGVSQPMILSVMHRAAPPGRVGEATGLRLTLVNGTQTFLPMLFGALGGAFGLSPVFWAVALLVGGGAFYARRGQGGGRGQA